MKNIHGRTTSAPQVIFTYHAMDRVSERFPHISKLGVTEQLSDQRNWLASQIDGLSGGNKRDGVKLIITIRVEDKTLKAIIVKKVEDGKPTIIVLSVHL